MRFTVFHFVFLWGVFSSFALGLHLPQALKETCRQASVDGSSLLEQRREIKTQKKKVCSCFADKISMSSHQVCRALEKWEQRARVELRDYLSQAKLPLEDTCATYLAEAQILSLYWDLEMSCGTFPEASLKQMLSVRDFELDREQDSCWKIEGITASGCLRAAPCGREANMRFLPLNQSMDRKTSESVLLCQENLQKTEHLKNPQRFNLSIANPLFSYLTRGRIYELIEYGAANCHGTAQSLAGNFLRDLPVTHVKDWSGDPKLGCFAKVNEKFVAAGPAPTIAKLSVSGGVTINMNHESEDPTDCGEASLIGRTCHQDGVTDYIFIDKMSIGCWDHFLREKAGMERLNPFAHWGEYVPGCIFTQQDHSITLLMQSAGMCFFYESASPFSVSRVGVLPCLQLMSTFHRQWCPQKPMTFTLGSRS